MSFWKTMERIGLVEVATDSPPPPAPPPVAQNNVVTQPSRQEVDVQQYGSVVDAQPQTSRALGIQAFISPERQRQLDEAARTVIIQAMQNDNAPLVEEVSDTLETLEEGIPGEGSRFKMMLKMFVKRGLSVPTVLNDFDKCLGVLDQCRRNFDETTKAAHDGQVGSKVRSVEKLNAEIESLRRQLSEKTAQRDTEQASISVEEAKIVQTQERFNFIYGAIRQDIEQKRAKIAQYGEGL